jgi:hypothetical protein
MDRRIRAKDMIPRTAAAEIPSRNLLLATLPSAESRQLIARCERVELTLGDVLYKLGDRIRQWTHCRSALPT